MTLAGVSIKRPVATTMVMVAMMFIGIMAMFSMKSELLPNMNIPVVTVSTRWTGAVPEDVESQITKQIEEILPNVESIEKITSTSSFGQSRIIVNFQYGVDAGMKMTEIQREISKLTNRFPDSANEPFIRKIDAGTGNLTMVIIFSAKDKIELRSFLEQYFQPKLERIAGIGEVNIFGSGAKQVQIQVDSDKLAAYNLTPMELYSLISASSLNVALGTVSTGDKQYAMRFMGEMDYIDNLENMIIHANGNTLRLREVADVVLTTEDLSNMGHLNDKDSIVLIVTKAADGSTIDLNKGVLKAFESLKPILPAGTEYKITLDTSIDINKSIEGVTRNAVQGLILATVILFLFLKNLRATMISSAALPVAITFTFAFLYMAGSTLNMVSLMGLSIGVGMLTDNSVVVMDNIYRHMTELKSPVMEAADNGTTEVAMSVIASALTTMIVFIPVLFIKGITRELFRDLSYAIIFSNIAALIVSLTLIPMLSSRILSERMNVTKEGFIFTFVKKSYMRLIRFAIRHRILVVGIALIAFVGTMLGPRKMLKVRFFPQQDQGRYSITADLGNGIDLDKADRLRRQVTEIIRNEEHTQQYFSMTQNTTFSVNVDVGKKDTRDVPVFDIVQKVRKEVEKIPGMKINMREDYAMGGQRRSVEFQILGSNLTELRQLGDEILAEVIKEPGLVDVKSSLDPGNTEARIVLNREKIRSYGINPATVGETLSYYILGGNRDKTVTIKTGIEEIDVLVRLPKAKRNDINQIKNLNIRISPTEFVKLSDIADVVIAEGTSQIQKTDRVYSVSIAANDGGIGNQAMQERFLAAFRKVNPPSTITYKWGGDAENMNKSMSQLFFALGVSLFLIYALLASQFESFMLPIVVIGSIPLAVVGVVYGLILMKLPIDVMALIGVIMLAGVVVNNAIVLVDFIKMMRERGLSRTEAVLESCRTRLRPIVMTTATTILGTLPLSLGIGEGSEIYQGMGVTVMFGLTFSTLLTLVVIPILYTLAEDINLKISGVLKAIYGVTFGRFRKA
ncbi:MAG: efflux RND transporter permease subunit [Fusobacteriaceae bacterium]|jgi:HAE1 family hydrophobic/amphiphilic exporter-1|nr:efflux RND transporter permease subunit [Fusobacteriaceae bacterium]